MTTTKADNVMNIDEAENFVKISVGKILKTCKATSKANRASTSKGKRGVDQSDKGTPKDQEMSQFKTDPLGRRTN